MTTPKNNVKRRLCGSKADIKYYAKYYLPDHRDYLTPQRTRREVSMLMHWLGRKPKTVCDIGCGDGRHLAEFARLGVTQGYGFDASKTLVSIASDRLKHYPNYTVERKAFSGWKPKSNQDDLVYSVFSAFGHCGTVTEARRLIAKAVASLKRGGLLCIDTDNVFRLIRFLESREKRIMKTKDRFAFDAIRMVLTSYDIRKDENLISKTRYFLPLDFISMLVDAGIRKGSISFKGSLNDEPYSYLSPRLVVLAKK